MLILLDLKVETVALVGKYNARLGVRVEAWRAAAQQGLRIDNQPDASQAIHVLQCRPSVRQGAMVV
jgi:hypothetical protein